MGSAAVHPFCYCIGWDSEDQMLRTCVACGLGVTGFTGLRLVGFDSQYIAPFSSSIAVLGGIGHYLALLIASNRWHNVRDTFCYRASNLCMLASLFTSISVGRIYGLPGLANTATTFGVLWCMEKACDANYALG